MNKEELNHYVETEGGKFWVDAGNHWLNERFNLKPESQVIEVGGYLGNWTAYIHEKYGCFVDVYEPVKEYAVQMIRRFSANPKVNVRNYGVEDYDGEAKIAVMDDGSSMYNGFPDNGPTIFMRDVSEVVEVAGEVDLLALNCEGSEYKIISRLLDTGTISNVKEILVQFHHFIPDAWQFRNNLRHRLTVTHEETMCYPFMWESWRRK